MWESIYIILFLWNPIDEMSFLKTTCVATQDANIMIVIAVQGLLHKHIRIVD